MFLILLTRLLARYTAPRLLILKRDHKGSSSDFMYPEYFLSLAKFSKANTGSIVANYEKKMFLRPAAFV